MKIETEIFSKFFEKLREDKYVPTIIIDRLADLLTSNRLKSHEQILAIISEMNADSA